MFQNALYKIDWERKLYIKISIRRVEINKICCAEILKGQDITWEIFRNIIFTSS